MDISKALIVAWYLYCEISYQLEDIHFTHKYIQYYHLFMLEKEISRASFYLLTWMLMVVGLSHLVQMAF